MEKIVLFGQLKDTVFVEDYLRSIANQTYDKSAVHLFFDVSALPRPARLAVAGFLYREAEMYGSVLELVARGENDAQRRSLEYASDRNAHYFAAAQNVILHPATIERLLALGHEIVAPMLMSLDTGSNFRTAVREGDGLLAVERRDPILRYEDKGVHQVTAVDLCYLVRRDCVHRFERDGGGADPLCRCQIPQFVDNTHNYGALLTYSDATPAADIVELDFRNNKHFFLNLPHSGKRAVVCDADWLQEFIAVEHYYLIKLLYNEYGFDIVNGRRLDLGDPGFGDDLGTYDVVLTAYHARCRIPLDHVSAYKIYRMDDLENNPWYDDMCRFHMAHSDLVVSPYAYTLRRFFQHPNVAWIPYSCALEGCDGYEDIRFNADPTPKVLVSGNLAATYELRRYAATLEDERLEKMPHPGYYQPRGGEPDRPVRTRYFQILNEYLCCFTDALVYRYVLLKNFEISSVGALLLTERSIEPEMTALGFVDYETCIFCGRDDFLDKVAWITDPQNRPQVDAIRRAGMRLVRDRHMTQHRATQLGGLAGPMSLDHSTAVSRIANVSLATAA